MINYVKVSYVELLSRKMIKYSYITLTFKDF